jgi:hypothetical protein
MPICAAPPMRLPHLWGLFRTRYCMLHRCIVASLCVTCGCNTAGHGGREVLGRRRRRRRCALGPKCDAVAFKRSNGQAKKRTNKQINKQARHTNTTPQPIRGRVSSVPSMRTRTPACARPRGPFGWDDGCRRDSPVGSCIALQAPLPVTSSAATTRPTRPSVWASRASRRRYGGVTTSALGPGSPRPEQLRGLGSPLPHLLRDWDRACRSNICTGTGPNGNRIFSF